ncbi:MAG: hypothetical protein U5J63_17820 [Fodinibius sp.]|nr:hypothetical protein [Fodinibius sp.]
MRANGGYSNGYEQWNYGGGLSLQWLDQPNIEATIGADYTAQTVTRMNSPIYKPYYTIIPNLLGNAGYFDYYRSEGFPRLFQLGTARPQSLTRSGLQ